MNSEGESLSLSEVFTAAATTGISISGLAEQIGIDNVRMLYWLTTNTVPKNYAQAVADALFIPTENLRGIKA